MKVGTKYTVICLLAICANRALYAADDHESKLSNEDFAQPLSAEQLKPLVRYGDGKVGVPIYNATSCALTVQTIRAGASFDESTYANRHELSAGCMRLLTLADTMEKLNISTPVHRGGRRLSESYRTHRSVYSAKDILPISEALRLVITKDDKIALLVGEKALVPTTREDEVHYSTLE